MISLRNWHAGALYFVTRCHWRGRCPGVLAAYGCQRSSQKLHLWLIPLHRFLFALQDWHHIFFINFGFSFCNFLIAYPRLALLQHRARLWRIHLRILSFCCYLLRLPTVPISGHRISPCCEVLCAAFHISFLIFSRSIIPLFSSLWVHLSILVHSMIMMTNSSSFEGELLKMLLLILIDWLRFLLQPFLHVEFDLLEDLFDGALLALYHLDDLALGQLEPIEFTKDFLV